MQISSLVFGLLATHAVCQTLTAEMISSMGNNSLFTRWRPISRISAPAGWMNDPCGPMYDPSTELYHMHYQWHPNHVNWGNISWGHATSPDMIYWTDVDHFPNDTNSQAWQDGQAQSIGTTNLTSSKHDPAKYNFLGIFSGTAQPVNISGEDDGTMLAFYTSVSRLPFSWDQAYPAGAETQSLPYSYDGGVSWQEYPDNPVLPDPPGDWNITGWRDPFFLQLPYLDGLLNYTDPHYYCIFGAGINGSGPRAPLYSAPSSNLANWTFLGALWEPGVNVSLGDIVQTGTYGQQWEVPNFFNIDEYWYVSSGIQGGIPSYRSFWNVGNVSARANGSILYTPIAGGAADWGNLYAITSFEDTKFDPPRRIQIGWSPEDNNNFGIMQNGYQGALSLPKVLYNKFTPNVAAPSSNVTGNSVYIQQPNGTYSALTLGAAPAPDVIEGLRNGSQTVIYNTRNYTAKGVSSFSALSTMSKSYELHAVIKSTTGPTGLIISASPNLEEYTTISYDPNNSSITVDRLHSSLITQFQNTSYVGHFTPYPLSDGSTETIDMRIFVDGSLVEVAVNDRFWLTARVYPSREDSVNIGLYAAPGVSTQYVHLQTWDGLVNVWPGRPLNSSSLQVFDSREATNNYTWWQGN